jgi:phytoene dehydrogenase-like protein
VLLLPRHTTAPQRPSACECAQCAADHAACPAPCRRLQVGGRCQSKHLGDPGASWRFDTGPSLLLFPGTYHKCFAALGRRLEDHLTLARVQPAAYRVWFAAAPGGGASDGVAEPASSSNVGGCSYLDLLYDVQRMVAQLEGVEPGGGRAYLQWLAEARAALEVGGQGGAGWTQHMQWWASWAWGLGAIKLRLTSPCPDPGCPGWDCQLHRS